MAKKKTLTKEDYLKGLKTIFHYLAEHRQAMKILIGVALVLSVTNPLIPYITGKMLDTILKTETFHFGSFGFQAVYGWLLVWLLVQLITYTLEQVRSFQTGVLDMTLYARYVANGYNHLLNLPLSFHKKKKMGPLLNSIQRSANMFSDISTRVIINLAPQFLSILVAISITITVNAQIAGLMLCGVLAYILVLMRTIAPGTVIQRKIQAGWMKAWRAGHDSLDNLMAVKQMTAESYEQRKNIRNFLTGALGNNILMVQLMKKIGFYQKLIILVTQTIVFVLAIIFIQRGEMTIGQLIAITSYTGMLFAPFITLGDYWRTVQNGFISLEESEKILKAVPEEYEPAGAISLPSIKGKISFQNVHFSYEPKTPVLKNINFEIKAGEVIALVGKSGEGKSTLIDLLSGYNFVNKGKILIDDVDVKKINLKFLRSHIGIVPQEVVLFNDTIGTNIKYGNFEATEKAMSLAAEKAHALEFITKFPKKWKQVVGDRGVKLSVGQKQRVAIARAILRNPAILILDEPTSALDAESEHFITNSLEELMRGRTTFIIAHRLSTVRRADKIFVFQGGEIVETGKHDELITRENGVYRHLYELQIGLHK
ncbi:MAG: hypothetical protein A2571_02615 [Candidatus Vogelbacteria bacterium RIFOXYD1_FULL_44_32]|uniref:ABC transporter ATP-binding protein n=1 Tax=Candidatus Vogelbacteria bacterium RIFOXYD1_FULL_44_32 TaxID=1802438 RepID=A0A1G2QDN8_9BACT|nr:MAG: hypothetical protein A2571_02615 [Candidatus Vogelbacteria bacterium RIFOXYD1_FULL_44_32]